MCAAACVITLTLTRAGLSALFETKDFDMANRYKEHVVEQGATILKNRKIECLFTTPKLLEALG